MENTPERPRSLQAGTTPPDHRLPSGANKVERIAQHSKGLVDEITDWVELKIKLTQLEIQEKVDEKINGAVIRLIPVVVGALGGFFLLVTAALGLGWWLGHPFWGFLIVTVLLLLTAAVVKANAAAIQRAMSSEHRIRVPLDALDGSPDGERSAP